MDAESPVSRELRRLTGATADGSTELRDGQRRCRPAGRNRAASSALLLRPADRKLNERKANGHGILNSGEPTLHIAIADGSARGCGQN